MSLRNISGDIVFWIYVWIKLIQKDTKIIYIACSHKNKRSGLKLGKVDFYLDVEKNLWQFER